MATASKNKPFFDVRVGRISGAVFNSDRQYVDPDGTLTKARSCVLQKGIYDKEAKQWNNKNKVYFDDKEVDTLLGILNAMKKSMEGRRNG